MRRKFGLRVRWLEFAAAICLWGTVFLTNAQETVQFPIAEMGGGDGSEKADATLSLPAAQSGANKLPAVVLLHSAWGWAEGHDAAGKYGTALAKAGFVALQVHMFANSSGVKGGPAAYLPYAFGALKYLAARSDVDPKRIAVAGYSFGGGMAILTATVWANKSYGSGNLRFASHAPFYPVCWAFTASAKGQRQSPVPIDAWTQWTGAPVKIFAGAIDDYDDKDPNACQDFVNALPESQRGAFSIRVYPGATHGWDQNGGASFFEKLACKGRGCNNTNQPSPEAARESIRDLLEFLTKAMPAQ